MFWSSHQMLLLSFSLNWKLRLWRVTHNLKVVFEMITSLRFNLCIVRSSAHGFSQQWAVDEKVGSPVFAMDMWYEIVAVMWYEMNLNVFSSILRQIDHGFVEKWLMAVRLVDQRHVIWKHKAGQEIPIRNLPQNFHWFGRALWKDKL
jgi:hypothetical protein